MRAVRSVARGDDRGRARRVQRWRWRERRGRVEARRRRPPPRDDDHVVEHVVESTSSTTATTDAVQRAAAGRLRPEVTDLQTKLAALNYDVTPDGSYSAATMQAVMAFQKVNGLGRDGVAGDADARQARRRRRSRAARAGRRLDAVEVDVARQVLFFYQGNALFKIVAVSTGAASASASTVGARPR